MAKASKKTTKTTKTADRVTFEFATTGRDGAWNFMKLCDGVKIAAGYPTLRAPYTVTVLVSTWCEREVVDAFAVGTGGVCVGYEFGKAVA